jgi:hypothetical protein
LPRSSKRKLKWTKIRHQQKKKVKHNHSKAAEASPSKKLTNLFVNSKPKSAVAKVECLHKNQMVMKQEQSRLHLWEQEHHQYREQSHQDARLQYREPHHLAYLQ